MNAIIDMIADGIICKDCRELIDGDATGYERSCGCEQDGDCNIKNTQKECLK